MSYEQGQNELKKMIIAGYPLIYVVTDDERPVIETLKIISEKSSKKYDLFTWNQTTGIFHENGLKHDSNLANKEKALEFARNHPANSIFLLQDFHVWFNEPDILLKLKDSVLSITVPVSRELMLKRYEQKNGYFKSIIITAPVLKVPEELNKLMSVVQFGLPGKKEIYKILDIITKSKANQSLSKEEKDKIVNASLGLTETEIFNAYTKSMVVNDNKIIARDIISEKKQIIQKDGLLEFHEPNTGMGDVGGLKNLINWVRKRKLAYNEEIRLQRKLELPKGLLLTGIQGCGKSHSVKAIANFLEMPLIRLDIGALMGKWVGQSEENTRRAIELAESISPCVLWIDEIDKGIPSPNSSSTHEVSKRVTSTLLTWLQEKKQPVFVVATANNIDHLPPELMRKGRFDEIFFVDLPTFEERKEILAIHFKKRDFNPGHFDLNAIAHATEQFSGAEIEVLINEANFQAAYLNEDLETKHLLAEASDTNPLAKTMKDKIDAIRDWKKKNNVRSAT